LTTEPELSEPTRRAVRTVADHLGDLVQRGQADGDDVRAEVDPEAAAWLLLSVLSARPLRTAVMPDPEQLEGRVAAVALGALLAPHPRTAARRAQTPRSGSSRSAHP
jgi:hypothetical protein